MKTIELSDGRKAFVDDADFSRISTLSWSPHDTPRTTYAFSSDGSQMHRVIMRAQKGQFVDHRDGDGLNNTRSNLRFCTQAQNNANVRLRTKSVSGFKGVHWYPPTSCWRAQCRHKHVGYFATAEEAARAYDARARIEFGDFARLNFSDEVAA